MDETVNKYLASLITLRGFLLENSKVSFYKFCKENGLNNRFSQAVLNLKIIKKHGKTKASFYTWESFFPTYEMATRVLQEINQLHGKRKVEYPVPSEILNHKPIIKETITHYFFGLIKIKKVYKYHEL